MKFLKIYRLSNNSLFAIIKGLIEKKETETLYISSEIFSQVTFFSHQFLLMQDFCGRIIMIKYSAGKRRDKQY